MKHSIVIPHRNRAQYIPACLWSILRSAIACDIPASDWKCWVVDLGSAVHPEVPNSEHFGLCRCPPRQDVFNKPLALNIGIDLALRYDHADVLTFLDGDAIVGKRWMENVSVLFARPELTKLSFRVRYVSPESFATLPEQPEEREEMVSEWFSRYGTLTRGFESYNTPTNNHASGEPVFGNSQFSIRTDVLSDLRWNEDFAGRGSEDFWMMREIARRQGWDDKHPEKPHAYRCEVVKDADHALLHVLQTRYEEDWFPKGRDIINFEKYRNS